MEEIPTPWCSCKSKSVTRLRNASNDFMCKAFPTYLTGQAQLWFGTLSPGSIRMFHELGTLFHTRFFQGKKIRKTITELMSLKQDQEESIGAYYSCFTKEQLQVEGISEETIVATFTNDLYPYGASATLRQKLTKEPPQTLQQLFSLVETEVRAEEDLRRARESLYPYEKRSLEYKANGFGPAILEVKSPTKPNSTRFRKTVPGRRNMSQEKWNEITTKYTEAVLERLISSPEFDKRFAAQAQADKHYFPIRKKLKLRYLQ
ncbi:OLC1v1004596C1 [Oldenlandia corymbosa var. corymbosa]|uniref:OLC1v1004596C1 n=1 Tax=Oldenlandia corymbosa var. corymbosa TaxID=529605 RepID=A0AAV1DG36_OLDCO|nr:OLC1v1004596C1 [Oldenlandia corymbosa var. corymbosa]